MALPPYDDGNQELGVLPVWPVCQVRRRGRFPPGVWRPEKDLQLAASAVMPLRTDYTAAMPRKLQIPVRLADDVEIAPEIRVREWRSLDLATSAGWARACDILYLRFQTRFFDMVELLLDPLHTECQKRQRTTRRSRRAGDPPPYRPGFAIMAILCLLVETLYQFAKGLRDTDGRSKQAIQEFLSSPELFISRATVANPQNFGNGFTAAEADVFYTTIRCGIYHAGELTGGSEIHARPTATYLHQPIGTRGMDLNRGRFLDLLHKGFDLYIDELRRGEDVALKHSFIRKMEFICGAADDAAERRASTLVWPPR